MKPAEREAARQRQRELTELVIRSQRRAMLMFWVRVLAGLAGYLTAITLVRVLVRHEPFSVAATGLYAAACVVSVALVWCGYLAWERLASSSR